MPPVSPASRPAARAGYRDNTLSLPDIRVYKERLSCAGIRLWRRTLLMTTETMALTRRLAALDSLNLGCGTDIRADCINLDRSPLPGVDVVHDLAQLPLPFPAGRFNRIVCQDVLEHVDIVTTMRELHRILASDGILEVRV